MMRSRLRIVAVAGPCSCVVDKIPVGEEGRCRRLHLGAVFRLPAGKLPGVEPGARSEPGRGERNRWNYFPGQGRACRAELGGNWICGL